MHLNFSKQYFLEDNFNKQLFFCSNRIILIKMWVNVTLEFPRKIVPRFLVRLNSPVSEWI